MKNGYCRLMILVAFLLQLSLFGENQAFAQTPISQKNIVGKYEVVQKDMGLQSQILVKENAKAEMIVVEGVETMVCPSLYDFNEATGALTLNLATCAGPNDPPNSDFNMDTAYLIDLQGQSIESVSAGTNVNLFIKSPDGLSPSIEISIIKR